MAANAKGLALAVTVSPSALGLKCPSLGCQTFGICGPLVVFFRRLPYLNTIARATLLQVIWGVYQK